MNTLFLRVVCLGLSARSMCNEKPRPFCVTGALYTCRPDLVGFVSSQPLVVIELKKPLVPARVAFDKRGGLIRAVQSDQPLRYSRWSRLLAGFEFKILPLSVSYSTGHELVGDEERFLVAA